MIIQSPLGAAPIYRQRAPIRCGYMHSKPDADAAIKRYLHHSLNGLECSRSRVVVNKAACEGKRSEVAAFGDYPCLGELYNKYHDLYRLFCS